MEELDIIPSMSLRSSFADARPPLPVDLDRRLLENPVAMRALAHPLRLELMSIVGRAGKITTAEAARRTKTSHGLASHHLHQLQKYGFVEQTDGKDNRERPWTVTYPSTSWAGADATTEGAAAASTLERAYAEQALSHLTSWLERRGDWPAAWREHTGIGQATVYLTLPELAELDETIESAVKQYVRDRPLGDAGSRPPDSVPVEIWHFIVPLSAGPKGD